MIGRLRLVAALSGGIDNILSGTQEVPLGLFFYPNRRGSLRNASFYYPVPLVHSSLFRLVQWNAWNALPWWVEAVVRLVEPAETAKISVSDLSLIAFHG